MWKIFAGFIVFALAALFVIMKGGDKVDMQGETSSGHAASESASAPAAATLSATAASMPAAASAAASK
jgi:hypothetical protein